MAPPNPRVIVGFVPENRAVLFCSTMLVKDSVLSVTQIPPPNTSFALVPMRPSLRVIPLNETTAPSEILKILPALFPLMDNELLPGPAIVRLLAMSIWP